MSGKVFHMTIWFVTELEEVLDALDEAAVEYALVGGLAVAIYGAPRATMDIDVLTPASELAAMEDALRTLGFEAQSRKGTLAAGIGVQRFGRLVPFGGTGRMLFVDVLQVSEEIRDVWKGRVVKDWRDRKISVVSVDGLLKLKQIAGRGRDLGDIEELLAIHVENGDGD